MKAEDILALMYPATYLVMLAIEAIAPARSFPKVRWWRPVGFLGLVMIMSVAIVTPLLLPVSWLEQHRLIDGTKLGVPLGVIVGYAIVSLVSSLWHRAIHRSTLLWRLFHQMHHAPRRLDLSGGNVFHPLDLLMFTGVQVVALTLVIGLDPLAAALTGYVAGFYMLFQHWNVKTPRWLGYIIQRPELHGCHHELDVHASNYSDLPLWDILFRTFKNPERFEGEVGFSKPSPVHKMLLFVDVNVNAVDEEPPSSQHPLDAAAE